MTCRLATALRHKEGLHKYMGTAWIIASGKGGVGKSTLSACLGMEIARNGQRVCIVDADIGLRDQDVLLGVQDCIVYDILDVANGICPVDDALVVPKPDALPNLSLPPASSPARKSWRPRHSAKFCGRSKAISTTFSLMRRRALSAACAVC